jgi:hypothetical protein
MMSDPVFILAAQYCQRLPGELADFARAYWMEGRTLRELARQHKTSLHYVRSQLGVARSILVLVMSEQQVVDPERARDYFS